MHIRNALIDIADRFPDKTCLIFRDTAITFSHLKKRIFRLCNALNELGIKKEDKVLCYLPNTSEFVEIYLACLSMGIICVPVDPRIIGDELVSIINDSDAQYAFTSSVLLPQIRNAKERLKNIESLIVTDKVDDEDISYKTLIDNATEFIPDTPLDEEDEALFLYTSGSTGRPKGVILQYLHLDLFPESLQSIIPEYTTQDEVIACLLPMSHITGPIIVNTILKFGCSLVIIDNLKQDYVWKMMERHRVTLFNNVPPIMRLLLSDPQLQTYDLSSLKYISLMGMSVPKSLIEQCRRLLPHLTVIQGYGLTETSPLLTLVPIEYATEKIGSVGVPVPGVELKILDEFDQELPVGQPGEIVVRGPQVMKGYYKQPIETNLCIRNGWFYTGDLGKIDKDGFVYHLGRANDMVITGGLIVYPAEVEDILHKHHDIMEAAVVSIPDPKRGEVLAAFIVKRPGSNLKYIDVMKYCRVSMADYKVPRMIMFVDKIPLTGSGKLDKNILLKTE
ncbi:MAG: acyl--CoA ligase [Deltaproteobacteria bacterium]|nr:acyl--CoA ligase [Candidatus Zymogenaceae bacterium]